MGFEIVIATTLTILGIGMMVIYGLDVLFKFKWTCTTFGWHDGKDVTVEASYFDGCSVHSRCSKCGKKVMQDSQGNWF